MNKGLAKILRMLFFLSLILLTPIQPVGVPLGTITLGSEVRSQKSEDRRQRLDVRGQIVHGRQSIVHGKHKSYGLWTMDYGPRKASSIQHPIGGTFLSRTIQHPASSKEPKVVILIINNINWEDLSCASAPGLNYLIENGSLGLMNTRTARPLRTGSAYLTIGSSSRAYAGKEAGEAFGAEKTYEGSKVSQVYLRRTGKKLLPSQIANPNIAQIIKENQDADYEVKVGALGQALKEAGLSTAALGNADTKDEFHREIVSIVMDEEGRVDSGEVGKRLLVKDEESPFGVRTDTKRLLLEFEKVKDKSLIAIELGDTFRVDEYSKKVTEAQLTTLRRRALLNADKIISELLKRIDLSRTLLLIITPCPTLAAKEKKNTLTPIIILKEGERPGLLTSFSTRRRGIVTNCDIAPTILIYLGIKVPPFTTGRKIYSEDSKSSLKEVLNLNRKLASLEAQRRPLLYSVVIFQSIASILVLIFTLLKARLSSSFFPFSNFLLLSLAALPLGLLLLPLIFSGTILKSAIFLILIILLLAVLSKGAFSRVNALTSLYLILTLILAIDILSGSNLMKYSLLGYSFIEGSRFYGIGNEYMGVLVSSSLIGITLLLDRPSSFKILKKLFIPFSISIFLLIALPVLGANVGGGITAIFAFGFAYLKLSGQKINFKRVTYLILLLITALGALALLDLSASKVEESHLGRFIESATLGGPLIAFKVISRKLSMNLTLIHYTIWSKVLLVSLGIITVLFFKPAGILKKIADDFPHLFSGLLGVAVGSIAGLIFNDSGIIVAAWGMFFITITLLYLIIDNSKPA